MTGITAIAALAALVFAAAASGAVERRADVTIVANPGPFASVEEAARSWARVDFWDESLDDDGACTEGFAATELARFLPQCVSVEHVTLQTAGPLPDTGTVIVLGTRRSNPQVSLLDQPGEAAPAFASPEGFRIRASVRKGMRVCVVEGASRVGVLYGAYALLERLGVRFFGLGEQGTSLPRKPSSFPARLDIVESPAFQTRGFYAWEGRGTEEFFLWMARNRMNFWTSAEKDQGYLKMLGMKLAIGTHDLQTNFLNPRSPARAGSKQTMFDAHPEWFGLRGGKRSSNVTGNMGDNFCTSNDDAVAELASNLTHGLSEGIWRRADIVNFWMEDGGKWCECEPCKTLGTPTDRLLRLVCQVNRVIQAARREGRLKRPVHLTTLAYTETVTPPTRPLPADFDYENCSITFYPIQRCYAHAFADPDCHEFNKRYAASFAGWTTGADRHYRGAMFIGEYYNVSNYKTMPVLYTRTMPTDVRGYHAAGARHFQYMHTPVRLWGTWTLNQCLLARLLWNPTMDEQGYLGDYFARRYPTTSRSASAFYRHLEDAFANIACQKTYLPLHMNRGLDPLLFKHLTLEQREGTVDRGPSLTEIGVSLKKARADLDRAIRDCAHATERLCLAEDARRMAYGEAMMAFYTHMVRVIAADKQGDAATARAEFTRAEQQAEILRTVPREMIETFGCPDAGFEATQAVGRYNTLKTKYGGG